MLIASEYGYGSVNLTGMSPSPDLSQKKESASEFDMLLSFFRNSQAKGLNTEGIQNSVEERDISLNSKREDLSQYSSPVEEREATEAPVKKEEGEKAKEIKRAVVSKKTLLDGGYLAEINKKANALLDKIHKIKYPSSSQVKEIAAELQVLLLQFQKFSARFANDTESISSNLQKASPRDALLSKLLEGMSKKMDMAKKLLKDMEFSSQSLVSKVISSQKNIDMQLGDLKSLDGELSKTLQLLKELSGISQEGRTILQRHFIGNRTESSPFVSVNFSPHMGEPQGSSKGHGGNPSVHNGNHPTALKFSGTPEISLANSSSSENSSSGKEGGNSSQGQSHWNMTGVSGGVVQPKGGSENFGMAASHTDFRDKIQLGQNILAQMGQEMKGIVGKRESHLTINLNPEDLGDVKVILNMKDGVIKSHIVVQNDLVKDILKDRFEDVKALFSQNGVNVAEFGIHTEREFREREQSSSEAIEGIFQTQKHLAGQIKLQRHDLANNLSNQWFYDSSQEPQEAKNFTIVI